MTSHKFQFYPSRFQFVFFFFVSFQHNLHDLLCVDDVASGFDGSGGGGGGVGDADGLPSASLYVIVGHFTFASLGADAFEFESVRFCLDELRPRPNFRNENRGRKPNFILSHSALKLVPLCALVVASFVSGLDVDTIRLFDLCFRFVFFDELDLLLLLELFSPASMVAIASSPEANNNQTINI